MIIQPTLLREFGQKGYVVIPGVVDRFLIGRAMRKIDRLLAEQPPADHLRGPHFYWRGVGGDGPVEPFLLLLLETPAFGIAECFVSPARLDVPQQAQVALNIPTFHHRPGGPHIDGLTPPEPSGRPGTFTMLAGVFLTDQQFEDMGNLWVWRGTHLSSAAYFREHGADVLLSSAPYPPVTLPVPEQVLARAGDLLLAHYMLGHNIGGNTSSTMRRVVYFRLQCNGHRQYWRECAQDALREFQPVQVAVSCHY